mmetsp:Transcript_111006/g.354007  ORF Transcript_111006/g.354007 Transcript_111006/m.354007 type:complete len:214 (+) Transcript_111006:698-1339(+)
MSTLPSWTTGAATSRSTSSSAGCRTRAPRSAACAPCGRACRTTSPSTTRWPPPASPSAPPSSHPSCLARPCTSRTWWSARSASRTGPPGRGPWTSGGRGPGGSSTRARTRVRRRRPPRPTPPRRTRSSSPPSRRPRRTTGAPGPSGAAARTGSPSQRRARTTSGITCGTTTTQRSMAWQTQTAPRTQRTSGASSGSPSRWWTRRACTSTARRR